MEEVVCSECGTAFRRLFGAVALRPLCLTCVRQEIELATLHQRFTGCDEWPMCGVGTLENHA